MRIPIYCLINAFNELLRFYNNTFNELFVLIKKLIVSTYMNFAAITIARGLVR